MKWFEALGLGSKGRFVLVICVCAVFFAVLSVGFASAMIGVGQPGTTFMPPVTNGDCVDVSFIRPAWTMDDVALYLPVPYIMGDKSQCDLFGGYIDDNNNCVIGSDGISVNTKWIWTSSEGLTVYEQNGSGYEFRENDSAPWAYAGIPIQAIYVATPNPSNWNQTGWCPPKDAPADVGYSCYSTGGITGTFEICKNTSVPGIEPPVAPPASSGGGGGGGSRHKPPVVLSPAPTPVVTSPSTSPTSLSQAPVTVTIPGVVKDIPRSHDITLTSASLILMDAVLSSATKLVTTVDCLNRGQPGTCTSTTTLVSTKPVQGAMMNGYVYYPGSGQLTSDERAYASCLALTVGSLAEGGASAQVLPDRSEEGLVIAKDVAGSVGLAGMINDYGRLIYGPTLCRNLYPSVRV